MYIYIYIYIYLLVFVSIFCFCVLIRVHAFAVHWFGSVSERGANAHFDPPFRVLCSFAKDHVLEFDL
jgi:hypothetical protein